MDLCKAEYELMFRQCPLPMWIHDFDSFRFIDVNQAALEEFGYTREEILTMTLFDIRPASEHPRLRLMIENRRDQPVATAFDKFGYWVYLRKDGSRIDFEIRATIVHIGGEPARLVVARNVAEAQAAHNALRESEARYRALARRLQTIREEERVELSRTIHDELGQSLTALKIDLSMISKRLDPALQERIDAAAAAVDRMIQQVRNIATELRPGVLDHLGLVAALEWQAREFTRRSGISCQFTPPAEEPLLTQDQAVSLFRILQESLTNVVRHARASHVTVVLQVDSDGVRLVIEDDGIGLSEERRKDHASLGLIGMEERARFIDARLSIQCRAGRGTSVVVELPLQEVTIA